MSAEATQGTSDKSPAVMVRDALLLNEAIIVEVINDVVSSMPAHRAEVFRRSLKSNAPFGNALKRVAVDIGVILTLAKTFESDAEFESSASLVHDMQIGEHGGSVAFFAKSMVELDIAALKLAAEGKGGEDSALFDLLSHEAIERRQNLLLAVIGQMAATKGV